MLITEHVDRQQVITTRTSFVQLVEHTVCMYLPSYMYICIELWCDVFTAARRALPPIPTIMITSPSQRQTSPQTSFDNHTDIQWNVDGEAGIPTWRRSFFDDSGQYSNHELNLQMSDNSAEEQRQRSSGDYEKLNLAERQPSISHYTGIGSDLPPSRLDPDGYLEPNGHLEADGYLKPDGYLEPDEQVENVKNRIEEQLQQPSTPHDHSTLRLDSDSDQHRQEVPQRPCFYGDVEDTSSPTDRSGRHSYLEIIGYSGTDNGKTAKGYKGLDPAEVEELRRRANRPHEYAGLTDGNSEERHGDEVETEDYQGLDPVEVEEARQRARQPRVYAGLRDNVEDLYSRPIKKR